MLRTFVLSKSKFRWFFVALTCSTQDQDEICVGMPWSIERSVYNAFVAEKEELINIGFFDFWKDKKLPQGNEIGLMK